MLDGPGVGLRFYFDQLPWLPGALAFGDDWIYPGGAHNNRAYFSPRVRFDEQISEAMQTLCFAPETSGGLLLAVPPEAAGALLSDLAWARIIGEVTAVETPVVEVVVSA
jgi:selenide,water dikinase